jgi:hypothetical protein
VKAISAGTCAACGKPYEKGGRVRAGLAGDPKAIVHEICRRRAAKRRRILGEGK